ncbi:START domain-containing protein [Acinetobacter calcoaceticus]|uniref:START domain-containing protein n=1 Tax=Acinetobacter calcoaceticus TaxID=471 RepID=A0A4R1XSP8_ACICA|nr:START domain-containing protein [Acinetobacter calcoaceticus]
MKKIMFGVACISASLCLQTHAAVANNGKLSLNKNNIKVWTFPNPNSPNLTYKAETTLNVPIERAVALVLDVQRTAQWAPHVSKVEVLSRNDQKGEFSIYMVLDFPFPLQDRDLIVAGKVTKDSQGVIRIQNRAIAQGKALDSSYVRLKQYQGDWVFQKIDANNVKVMMSGFANPEGSIPTSVANMFVEQQPYQTLQKMKTELAKNPTLPALPAAIR